MVLGVESFLAHNGPKGKIDADSDNYWNQIMELFGYVYGKEFLISKICRSIYAIVVIFHK